MIMTLPLTFFCTYVLFSLDEHMMEIHRGDILRDCEWVYVDAEGVEHATTGAWIITG
jgi:hypothetical protein